MTRTRNRPDAGTEPAVGKSRSRVLAALHDAGTPLGVDEVAERVRLHPNTARFHLDALVEAGLAGSETEVRARPGRPRTLYAAEAEGARAGRRNYRLLAEILTGHLATQTPKPADAALRTGELWGRYLAERPPPFRRVDATAAEGQLVRVLDEIGFAPEAVTIEGERQVLLRHCPFLEAAEEHREVVCSIHLGLMRGLLAELDAPVQARRLDPFVGPSLCVTHLGTASDDAEPATPRHRDQDVSDETGA